MLAAASVLPHDHRMPAAAIEVGPGDQHRREDGTVTGMQF